ncbi:MAG: folate-binding protein [Ottowia sp.]|uniref:CAF17-like 4Fe-4S cluster assembly/insertion protein YgfZ n=1 Tax=Ottowia sp. TaxID=1898956 RepID=UPI0039E720D1
MSIDLHGIAPLPHLGVIRAAGEQAAEFLQGQLTQDVVLMKPGEARLAGYCNAKGRLLASFVACKRSPQEFWLVCSRDLLAPTLKKLSMFVLRAKVKLSDATDELALHGLIGDAASSIAAGADQESAGSQKDSEFLAPLPPAGGASRALWIGPAGSAPPPGHALSPALWDWAAVQSGVATVSAPVIEAFVPQMLNYESVGGVSFKKGCYPGQEVVARSQFRGAIKRRAFAGQVDGVARAGQEVFSAAEPDQPVGLVAQAAEAPQGGTAVIVSIHLAAAQAADLRVGAADGPALTGLHLPYPLLEDI